MLRSRNPTRTSETKQERRNKASDLVYPSDYRPNHRGAAAIVCKRHGSKAYEIEVGNEKWLQEPQTAETKSLSDF